jgi:hypothetical protein
MVIGKVSLEEAELEVELAEKGGGGGKWAKEGKRRRQQKEWGEVKDKREIQVPGWIATKKLICLRRPSIVPKQRAL